MIMLAITTGLLGTSVPLIFKSHAMSSNELNQLQKRAN